ncbi:hypothetical protein ACFRH9_00205 [Peribacillus butanolivorans]|uniref:hypothetical protein n=1 Tax=Peribacillus butanolivorans TaxID=421767 RepID=UPI00366E8AD7
MELFPGRKVELKGDDGRNIEAQYRFSLCKGPYEIFDVLNDNTFKWFKAQYIAPLKLQSAEAIDNKTIKIVLDKDPGMELFAGRSIQLQGEDGSTVQAQYRFYSCKGSVGIFDVTNNTLKTGVKYNVVPMNNWATADYIPLIVK